MTIAAGMPVLANLPYMSSPGVIDGALDRVQHVEAVGEVAEAVPLGVRLAFIIQSALVPMPSAASLSGPQTLNHQSLPNSPSTLRIARRKSSDSAMLSSTSARAAGRLHHCRRDVARWR